MAFDTTPAVPRPARGEAPFDIDEVLYSRTDPRGVIRAGNEVFRRVSDYGWDGLIGAPHRLIRHPDMPKGVFQLLWDRIRAGKSTGAYVRNQAQDGLHYWVFAVVSPIDDGYLAVRIKPSSPMFDTVQKEYAALFEAEAGGLDPVASADAFLARMPALGHVDYDDFMAAALAAELAIPARASCRTPSPQIAPIAGLTTSLRALVADKQLLLKGFEEIRAIPMNLHITASRIEVYGGPVATLAENYRLMAADIARRLEIIIGADGGKGLGEQMLSAGAAALFGVGCSQIQGQVVEDFRRPWAASAPVDRLTEIVALEQLARVHVAEVEAGLSEVVRVAGVLMHCCDELKRQMLGLDSIRVLCRVEAGRLQARGAGLASIIGQLDTFHSGISQRLDRILERALRIRGAADAAIDAGKEVWSFIRIRSEPRPQTPAPRPEPPGTSP
jgi:PAS fold